MVIYIPNTKEKSEPYYQQLARDCFTGESIQYDRIDLMVRQSIESAKQLTTELTGKRLNNMSYNLLSMPYELGRHIENIMAKIYKQDLVIV